MKTTSTIRKVVDVIWYTILAAGCILNMYILIVVLFCL